MAFAPPCVSAQVTTTAGASVLLFPLVVAGNGQDSIIELGNGSPGTVFVHCVYTPGGPGGVSAAISFDLVLVSHQPTHWHASTGRPVDPTDPPCSQSDPACDGTGLDPGRIPPLPDGFAGDLLCLQEDRSRAPVSGNALRGVVTVLDSTAADVAKYAAVGLVGLPINDADDTLCLGGDPSAQCPGGAEYAACPQSWLLQHRAEGAAPGAVAGTPGARTRLIIVTCSRQSGAGAATVQIQVTNEFEQRFSASALVQRWAEIALSDIPVFQQGVAGDFLETSLRAATTSPGIVVVALSDRAFDDGSPAGGAVVAVPHPEGPRDGQDRIILADQ